MKMCKKCCVDVAIDEEQCPLCQGLLVGNYNGEKFYPYIPTVYKKHQKKINWLLFICFFMSSICFIINIMFPLKFFWSGFVICTFFCLLLFLWLLLRMKDNIVKYKISQMIMLSILAYLWYYFIGWQDWSFIDAIPYISLICIFIHVILLGFILIFDFETVIEELKRRFHF